MDASKRPGRPEADPAGASPAGLAALAAALACRDQPVSTFAVGLSGGPDSVALACCAAQHARTHQLSLHFFHVDHGLHPLAGAWTRAAEQVGRTLGVPVHVARVHVDVASGEGIEAAARHARYHALADMARCHGASPVLLAHHQDDQAETVLHRLLRGSGVDGLRGMRADFDMEGARFLRPWLALPRASLLAHAQAWAAAHDIALADDPSNLDTRYARGALRRDVLPAMADHWPGYRATLTRFARHAETASAILQEVAQGDLAQIREADDERGDCLRLSAWLALSEARQALVLRAWLDARKLPMPSEARLQALCMQLRTSRPDRQLAWSHRGGVVRRYRDWVMLVSQGQGGGQGKLENLGGSKNERRDEDKNAYPNINPNTCKNDTVASPSAHVAIAWQGETSLRIDAFAGELRFDFADQGVDPAWLRAGRLDLRSRRGGERLQVRAGSPSRSLKNLYQEAGVPGWARDGLPLLYRDEQLVYAAGIGADLRVPMATPRVRPAWSSDRPGLVLQA